jgi:acyl-CoA hydrolase
MSSRFIPLIHPISTICPMRKGRIGELIVEHFIQDGVTLQTGIGKIPDSVIGIIRDGGFRDLGVQTELYGDGLMLLQKMGIVTNRKKKPIWATAPPA